MPGKLKYRLRYRIIAYRQLGHRKADKYASKTRRLLNKALAGMGEEARETEVMAQSFFRILEHKLNLKERSNPPTEDEVKEAIEQLKDVGRFSIFATISILPGGGFSLIGLELLARKFGITNFTFVPSAFRKKTGDADKENKL